MIASLVADAEKNSAVITWSAWSVPVFWANATTPTYNVTFTAENFGGYNYLAAVPIPAEAQPAAGSDGHMTVINTTNNCMYDFWQAKKQSNGSWTAGWANRMYTTDTGIYPEGASTRGSGFANLLGLLTPADFQAGVINHALMFASGVNRSGGPVAPATESDGSNAGTQYIPEGAHLRLNPSFDLSSYPAYLQEIGQALKTYGMYNGDSSGGGFSFYAVDTTKSDAPYNVAYPWGSNAYPSIPIAFLQSMEVLNMGSQVASEANPMPQPCATYH